MQKWPTSTVCCLVYIRSLPKTASICGQCASLALKLIWHWFNACSCQYSSGSDSLTRYFIYVKIQWTGIKHIWHIAAGVDAYWFTGDPLSVHLVWRFPVSMFEYSFPFWSYIIVGTVFISPVTHRQSTHKVSMSIPWRDSSASVWCCDLWPIISVEFRVQV